MHAGLRHDLDSLVRKATVGYGAWLLAIATAITAIYTFAIDLSAQSVGSEAAWRSDRAHQLDFKVPSSALSESGREPTGSTNAANEAISTAQVGLGTLASFVFAMSVLGFAAVSCMLGLEWSRHSSFYDCSSQARWGRHSLMTLLLWLVMVAITSETYFFYVPLHPGGGIFGKGPIMLAMGGMHNYLGIAGRMIRSLLLGNQWTVNDITAFEQARVAALGQPWASSVVVVLTVVASIIIGSTTAPRPQVEFRLKAARATWIVSGALCGGLTFTLAAGCMGLSLIGVTQSVLTHGMEGLQDLGNTLGVAGENASVSQFGPDVNITGLLQASVAGEDGVPLIFPALVQLATNEGQAGKLEALGMRAGQEGVLRAAQAWSQLDASVSESEAIELLAPQVNDVTTSQLNSGCLVWTARAEALAAHAAVSALRNQAARGPLPLQLSNGFFSIDPSRDTANAAVPMLPEQRAAPAAFVLFLLICTVTTTVFAISLVLTPSRGLDEATRAAAQELRSMAGRDGQGNEGGENDGDVCCSYRCMHEATIDAEVACARWITPACGCFQRLCCWCECCRCCCSMGLPRCCHPALKPVFVPARRIKNRRRNKAIASRGDEQHAGSNRDRQEETVRVNTRRWGRVGTTELRVAACMHETLVTVRHSLDLCGTDQDEGQTVGHSAADRAAAARRPSSLLVRSSLARARMLGASLKFISVLLLMELFLGPFTLSLLRHRSMRMCQCATARVEGLGPSLGQCEDSVAGRPLAELLGPVAIEYVQDSTAVKIVIRLIQTVLRVLLVASIYVYARQSKEMEQAVEVSERQKAALQSRVRFLSHECRVPLNSVVLGLDFCQEGASATKGALGRLHVARVQSDRLRQALIQDLDSASDGVQVKQGSRDLRRRHQIAAKQLALDLGETTEALEEAVGLFDDTLPSLEAATEAMQTTLNDVLALQHIESGRLQITMRLAPILPSILNETKKTFLAQAEGMGVSLETCNRHPASGKSFECDPPRIRGAVYNFVSNALKWSRPDEVLVKRLRDRGQDVAEGRGRGTRDDRPRVVVGSAERPPHLWGASQWREAWSKMGPEACSRLHRIVTGQYGGKRRRPHHADSRANMVEDMASRDASGSSLAEDRAAPHTPGPISAGPISAGALSLSQHGSLPSIGTMFPEKGEGDGTAASTPGCSPRVRSSRRSVKGRGSTGGSGSGSGSGNESRSSSNSRSNSSAIDEHEWASGNTPDSQSGTGDSWAVSDGEDPDMLAAAEAAAAVRRGACGPLSQMLEEEEDEESLGRRQPTAIGMWRHSRDAAKSTQREECDQLPTEAQIAPDTVEVYDELLRGVEEVSAGDDAGVLVHGKEGSATSGIAWEESAWAAGGNRGGEGGVEGKSGLSSGRSSSGDNDASSATSVRTSSDQVMPVCMWVYDEGPGIQRRDWRQVFTPFETLHSGILTAEGQGSGLGLAITATVMKMHGGCVGFSSMPGVGSVFFLWTKMRVAGGSTGVSSRSHSQSHSLPVSVCDVNDILGGTEAATIQLPPRAIAPGLSLSRRSSGSDAAGGGLGLCPGPVKEVEDEDEDEDEDEEDGDGVAGVEQETVLPFESGSDNQEVSTKAGSKVRTTGPVQSAGWRQQANTAGTRGDNNWARAGVSTASAMTPLHRGKGSGSSANWVSGGVIAREQEEDEEDQGGAEVDTSQLQESHLAQADPRAPSQRSEGQHSLDVSNSGPAPAGEGAPAPAGAGMLPASEGGGKRKQRRVVKKKRTKRKEAEKKPEAAAGKPLGSGSQAADRARTSEPADSQPQGKVVLVVDDSRTNRLFLSRMVRSADRSVQVLQASDGQEGLDVLKQRAQQMGDQDHGLAADLVLLDFSMPRMSGPEMARAVREDSDSRIRGVPIVGVTGNALPEDQALFRECGAQDVLLKPVRRVQVGKALGRMDELRAALA